jgi:hypothetical protein
LKRKSAHQTGMRSMLRLLCIVRSCHEAGIDPVPLAAIHAIAYFTDALAPIWNLPLIEKQLLKTERVPLSPELQSEIDRLVGKAVLLTSRIRHVRVDGSWSLDAEYRLNGPLSDPIFTAIRADTQFNHELTFVREVVLALAGLGIPGISSAVSADASYSDPNIDFGDILNLDESGKITRTTQVANRFAELIGGLRTISDAEATHLYVRHLYSILRNRDE